MEKDWRQEGQLEEVTKLEVFERGYWWKRRIRIETADLEII